MLFQFYASIPPPRYNLIILRALDSLIKKINAKHKYLAKHGTKLKYKKKELDEDELGNL